ncbi:hypothetical protein PS850_06115 [Pseudomonas fluorescens]|nr:hypothetical protein PS850_06115 [Pseudomonas fluorescens]
MQSPSLARIWGVNGKICGAGVLALPGYVVTCAHVVSMAANNNPRASVVLDTPVKLDFPFANTGEAVGRLVAIIPGNEAEERIRRPSDLAVIAVEFMSEGPAPCVLSSKDLQPGVEIWAYGFPSGYPNGSLAQGILQAPDARGWFPVVAGSSIGQFIAPGFSGAPIFVQHDQMFANCFLGIAVSADLDPSMRTGRMIPASMIAPILRGVTNPYRPMRFFESSDAEFFHGRNEFCDRIFKDKRRSQFVVLAGPTGCGKSSVVRAGLIPMWRREQFFTCLVPRFLDPLVDLGRALDLEPGQPPDVDKINSRLTTLANRGRYKGLVLVIDQLEDMFPPIDYEAKPHSLAELELLYQAMNRHRDRLRVILAIREDFLRQLLTLASKELQELIENSLSFVLPLNEKELHDAIVKPAEHFCAVFDNGLPEMIASDALRVQAPTAMLQIALDALWPKEEGGEITHAAYNTLRGEAQTGIEGAFANFADLALNQLPSESKEQLRKAMLNLVETSSGRRKAELLSRFTAQQQEVLCELAKSGLMSIRKHPDGELVEIGHESLIVTWKPLQQWLHETRAFRAWRDDMRARLPTEHTRQLLDGPALESALFRREQFAAELEADPEILKLIDESVTARDKKQREVEQIREEADILVRNERDRALRMQSIFLAAESKKALHAGDSGTALLLALEALPDAVRGIERPTTAEARLALRNALEHHNEAAVLIGHKGSVRCARFDQTGTTVISGGDDGYVGLWNATSGEKICFPLLKMAAPILHIWLSRDNQTLAVLSQDGQLQLLAYHREKTRPIREVSLKPGTYVYYHGEGEGFIIVPPGARQPELLIDGEVWKPKLQKPHWIPDSEITVMAWHGPANCWVSGHQDGSLALWRPESLEPCMNYLRGPNNTPIWTISCSSEGDVLKLLIVDEKDCLTKWRIKRTGERKHSLWSLHRVGGEIKGVKRAILKASGTTAVAVIRDEGRHYLTSIGPVKGNHDLGTVWRVDIDAILRAASVQREANTRPLLRIARRSKRAFLAIGPCVFQFEMDNDHSLVPIAVMRGAVQHISEFSGRIIVAGDDGTVRILFGRPGEVLILEEQELVDCARQRIARNLTSVQRIEHYLVEASAFEHADEIVTSPNFPALGVDSK